MVYLPSLQLPLHPLSLSSSTLSTSVPKALLACAWEQQACQWCFSMLWAGAPALLVCRRGDRTLVAGRRLSAQLRLCRWKSDSGRERTQEEQRYAAEERERARATTEMVDLIRSHSRNGCPSILMEALREQLPALDSDQKVAMLLFYISKNKLLLRGEGVGVRCGETVAAAAKGVSVRECWTASHLDALSEVLERCNSSKKDSMKSSRPLTMQSKYVGMLLYGLQCLPFRDGSSGSGSVSTGHVSGLASAESKEGPFGHTAHEKQRIDMALNRLVASCADSIAVLNSRLLLSSPSSHDAAAPLGKSPKPVWRKLTQSSDNDALSNSQYILSPQSIGMAMYGLHAIHCCKVPSISYQAMSAQATALAKQQSQAPDSNGANSRDIRHSVLCIISMLLPQMKHHVLQLESKRTTEFADSINKNSNDSSLNSQVISNIMYGCRYMSSSHKEVREFISVLSQWIRADHMCNIDAGGTLFDCFSGAHYNLQMNWTGKNISAALYGLQSFSSNHKEVLELLQCLNVIMNPLHVVPDGTGAGSNGNSGNEKHYEASPITALELSNAVYGFQNVHSKHLEVREIMDSKTGIVGKLMSCWVNSSHASPLSSRYLSNILYGCRNMSSHHKEVRDFISALTAGVRNDGYSTSHAGGGISNVDSGSPGTLATANGVAIANMLYGIQNMSSHYKEVRELLGIIRLYCSELTEAAEVTKSSDSVEHIKEHTYDNDDKSGGVCVKVEMSPQLLSMCGYGLKNLSSKVPEVRDLLQALIPIVKSSLQKQADQASGIQSLLTSHQISNILYGCQGLSSDHSVVRKYVNSLSEILLPSVTEIYRQTSSNSWPPAVGFNAQDIGNAMYGLQNMSLHRQRKHIGTGFGAHRGHGVGNAVGTVVVNKEVVGLIEEVVIPLLSTYPSTLGTAVDSTLRSVRKQPLQPYQFSAQAISNCFYGCQKLSNSLPNFFENNQGVSVDNSNHETSVTSTNKVTPAQVVGAVNQLLGNLCNVIEASLQSFNNYSTGGGVGGCNDNSGVRSRFAATPMQLSPQHIGNMLYGIQMLSAYPPVQVSINDSYDSNAVNRRVLPLISNLLELYYSTSQPDIEPKKGDTQCVTLSVPLPLDGQELANSVYGLKSLSLSARFSTSSMFVNTSTREGNCSADVPSDEGAEMEVVKLLQALTKCIAPDHNTDADSVGGRRGENANPIILNAQEFSMIYYGLQGLYLLPLPNALSAKQTHYPVPMVQHHKKAIDMVSKFVETLLPSLGTCIEPMTYAEFSMCCYGLRNFSSQYTATKLLVETLTKRLLRYGLVKERKSSNASMYEGLSTIPSPSSLKQFTAGYAYYDINKLIYGFQHLSASHGKSIRQLLTYVTPLLHNLYMSGRQEGIRLEDSEVFSERADGREEHNRKTGLLAIQRQKRNPSADKRGSVANGGTGFREGNIRTAPGMRWGAATSSVNTHLAYPMIFYGLRNIVTSNSLQKYDEVRKLITELCHCCYISEAEDNENKATLRIGSGSTFDVNKFFRKPFLSQRLQFHSLSDVSMTLYSLHNLSLRANAKGFRRAQGRGEVEAHMLKVALLHILSSNVDTYLHHLRGEHERKRKLGDENSIPVWTPHDIAMIFYGLNGLHLPAEGTGSSEEVESDTCKNLTDDITSAVVASKRLARSVIELLKFSLYKNHRGFQGDSVTSRHIHMCLYGLQCICVGTPNASPDPVSDWSEELDYKNEKMDAALGEISRANDCCEEAADLIRIFQMLLDNYRSGTGNMDLAANDMKGAVYHSLPSPLMHLVSDSNKYSTDGAITSSMARMRQDLIVMDATLKKLNGNNPNI